MWANVWIVLLERSYLDPWRITRKCAGHIPISNDRNGSHTLFFYVIQRENIVTVVGGSVIGICGGWSKLIKNGAINCRRIQVMRVSEV